jgi:hypothetical protein
MGGSCPVCKRSGSPFWRKSELHHVESGAVEEITRLSMDQLSRSFLDIVWVREKAYVQYGVLATVQLEI